MQPSVAIDICKKNIGRKRYKKRDDFEFLVKLQNSIVAMRRNTPNRIKSFQKKV
jgi:hypothetical protein